MAGNVKGIWLEWWDIAQKQWLYVKPYKWHGFTQINHARINELLEEMVPSHLIFICSRIHFTMHFFRSWNSSALCSKNNEENRGTVWQAIELLETAFFKHVILECWVVRFLDVWTLNFCEKACLVGVSVGWWEVLDILIFNTSHRWEYFKLDHVC